MYVTVGCCAAHPDVGLHAEIASFDAQGQGLLVMNAPFLLTVSANNAVLANSVATGEGLLGGRTMTDHISPIINHQFFPYETELLFTLTLLLPRLFRLLLLLLLLFLSHLQEHVTKPTHSPSTTAIYSTIPPPTPATKPSPPLCTSRIKVPG